MTLDAQDIAASAGRPTAQLTRRDVARGLLSVPSHDALTDLPVLRRQLIDAGNPLSAAFWDSATATLEKIGARSATVGDVQDWLETTGTEPAAMLGLVVWDDEADRSPAQAEVFSLLIDHLEGLLEDGLIDPDALVASGAQALQDHRRLQEDWMMAPLPDGRIPMWLVLDEEDEELSAEWAAAEADALDELREVLADLPERPVPEAELRAACTRIRAVMKTAGWPRDLLAACAGLNPRRLPADDSELWLTLAAGIVSPQDELAPVAGGGDGNDDEDLTDDEQAMVALCTLEHFDWLAVAAALAKGGPGTSADEMDLAEYVSEYDGGDDADDEPDDDQLESMFLHVVGLWRVLGAVDDDDRLTALGWWGVPAATQRAWQPSS
ncbi:MAG: hypothetical protein ACLQFR_07425 [Streptosporangiaceae bacterium]